MDNVGNYEQEACLAWGMTTTPILALTLIGAVMAPSLSAHVDSEESPRQHYGGRHEVETAAPLSQARVESSRRHHNIKTVTIQLATISVHT